MSRRTRLALGVLVLAVVGLHLGMLGGLQASPSGLEGVALPAPAPGALTPGAGPGPSGSGSGPGSGPGLVSGPDRPVPAIVLRADAGQPVVRAPPSSAATASAPTRVSALGVAPASDFVSGPAPDPVPAPSANSTAASSPARAASRPPAAPASRPANEVAASAPRSTVAPPSTRPNLLPQPASAPELAQALAMPATEPAAPPPAQRASEPSGSASGAAAGEPRGPAAALPPLPTYRTRLPPAARIVYRLNRGMIAGTGELDWRPQAGAYQLKLEGRLPLIGTLITQTSRGRLDAAGLAPERHTDQRLRRSEQAANFQREQGMVSFSGGARSLPLAPGLQDRLSVMIQLAAVAAAGPQPPPVGQALSIAVVGVRGDAAVWVLRFEGVQAIETPDGPVKAWHYLRQPESPHETVAEFWLDPTLQFLPVRVKLTDGNSEPLELRRQSHEP